MVTQLYTSISVVATSFVVLTYNDFSFTYFGIIAAALWVPANLFAVTGIRLLGLGVAIGTWAGLIVIISFIWGAVIFQDPVKNLWFSLLGMALILLGIVGVATCKTEQEYATTPQNEEIPQDLNVTHITLPETLPQNNSMMDIRSTDNTPLKPDNSQEDLKVDIENPEVIETPLDNSGVHPDNVITTSETHESTTETIQHVQEEPNLDTTPTFDIETTVEIDKKSGPEIVHQESYAPVSDFTQKEENHHAELLNQTIIQPGLSKLQMIKVYFHRMKKYIFGFGSAVMVAILAGSMYAPNRFNPDQGIIFIFSFGMGVAIVQIVVFPIYFLLKREWPKMHWKVAPVHGMASGLLWAIGNFCTNYIVMSPLGLTVGYPLVQTSFVIAGICGIVFFKEIRNWKVLIQFFAATFLLLVPGAITLGFFGKA